MRHCLPFDEPRGCDCRESITVDNEWSQLTIFHESENRRDVSAMAHLGFNEQRRSIPSNGPIAAANNRQLVPFDVNLDETDSLAGGKFPANKVIEPKHIYRVLAHGIGVL